MRNNIKNCTWFHFVWHELHFVKIWQTSVIVLNVLKFTHDTNTLLSRQMLRINKRKLWIRPREKWTHECNGIKWLEKRITLYCFSMNCHPLRTTLTRMRSGAASRVEKCLNNHFFDKLFFCQNCVFFKEKFFFFTRKKVKIQIKENFAYKIVKLWIHRKWKTLEKLIPPIGGVYLLKANDDEQMNIKCIELDWK